MFHTPSQRVAAGATFLDTKFPGWIDQIDLGILDISVDRICMLGQLEGSYTGSPEHFKRNAVGCGFFSQIQAEQKLPSGHPGVMAEYRDLTVAWRREIRRRRGRPRQEELLKFAA